MDIQFYHGTKEKYNKREFTVAMVVPPLHYFQNVLYEFRNGKDEFNLSFGISTVNKADGDVYVKKIGRIVSTEKIKLETVTVKRITVNKDGTTDYYLSNGKYLFHFEERRGRNKAHFKKVYYESTI